MAWIEYCFFLFFMHNLIGFFFKIYALIWSLICNIDAKNIPSLIQSTSICRYVELMLKFSLQSSLFNERQLFFYYSMTLFLHPFMHIFYPTDFTFTTLNSRGSVWDRASHRYIATQFRRQSIVGPPWNTDDSSTVAIRIKMREMNYGKQK